MQPAPQVWVHVVDDDASVREALSWLLRSRGMASLTHASGEAFLREVQALGEQPKAQWQPSCVLLDVRMPGMSGLAVFERLLSLQLTRLMPVIFLSGHADLATAVEAVRRGAFDFCEKPFSDNALVDRVEEALTRSREALAQLQARLDRDRRVEELTERERDVMSQIIAGLPNKLIADALQISVRTVEVHRARVFEKMAVKSAVELANLMRDDKL